MARNNSITRKQIEKRLWYIQQERRYFKGFIDRLKDLTPNINYDYVYSSDLKASPFDVLLKLYKGDNVKDFHKAFICEIKVRQNEWKCYYLEDYKLKALKKLQLAHPEYQIWYINFVPGKVIIFDLLKMDLGAPITVEMNSQTFKSTTNKVPKLVYCLDPSKGETILLPTGYIKQNN